MLFAILVHSESARNHRSIDVNLLQELACPACQQQQTQSAPVIHTSEPACLLIAHKIWVQ